MIGIYKITNLLNNKMYIGQSNNIQRRFSEHCYKGVKSRIVLDSAIKKYGKDNFSFEVLEECSKELLNERETYWIEFYNSVETGYNLSYGGDSQSQGENNGRALVSEEDVKSIRLAYLAKERRRVVYEKYKNKIAFSTFSRIWDGTQWSHIMPEVYSEESKTYFSRQATNGELSHSAKFSNAEVVALRERYVHETAKEIYEDVKNRCSYQTLQAILWGRSYKDLPIYRKKQKEWINK